METKKLALASALMRQTVRKSGVATAQELRNLCLEAEVRFVCCQMTVALLGFDADDFIDNIEMGGAATFFEFAGKANICLFI